MNLYFIFRSGFLNLPPPFYLDPRLLATVKYNHMEEFLLKSIQSLDTSVEEEYLRSNYATDINVGQFTIVECDILPVLLKKEKAICFKDIVSHLKGLGKRKNFFPIVL